VIPGEVEFTVDVRAPDDARRHQAEAAVLRELERIAKRRGVQVEPERGPHDVKGVPCASWLQDRLAASIERSVGGKALRLPSGAGHDAMILAESHRRRHALRALRRGRREPQPRRNGDRGRRRA
jgi:allantoate deiminase